MPNTAGERQRRARPADRTGARLQRPDGAQCDKRFNALGTGALQEGSSRPKTIHNKLDEERAERLKSLLHQSPRQFGKDTSVWTLQLTADVSFEQGVTSERVSDETIRNALKRLGVGWKRAKQWITSPDPEHARKKGSATG